MNNIVVHVEVEVNPTEDLEKVKKCSGKHLWST